MNDLLNEAPADVIDFVSNPENFGPFFVDAASFGGTLYGVPLFRGQSALFYNTDMFEAAGLTGVPQTMAEFTEYAEKLRSVTRTATPRSRAGRCACPAVDRASLRNSVSTCSSMMAVL